MRWSKLQRALYQILTDEIDLQIHCAAYPMHSQRGSVSLPRYWITLNKEIIFDYPKQFVNQVGAVVVFAGGTSFYPYKTDIGAISKLIREYIDTPKEEILVKQFDADQWGFIDILRAADRRFGLSRLQSSPGNTCNEAAQKVIEARLVSASPP